MPNRERAYRHPVSAQATARRIVRSIRDAAQHGVPRAPETYTTRPEVVALVRAALAGDTTPHREGD